MFRLGSHRIFHQRMETFIKMLHHISPLFISFGNFVKLFFDTSRKIIIHDLREVLFQEVINNHSDISRYQLRFFTSGKFCFGTFRNFVSFQLQNFIITFYSLTVSFFNISSLLDSRNSRCICRRTSDTQFFQLTYQASFCITWRSLSKAFHCNNLLAV